MKIPLAALLAALGAGHAAAQSSDVINSVTKPQIESLAAEKSERTPAQRKMSSHLIDALKHRQTGAVSTNAPDLAPTPMRETPEGVVVDIKAKVSDQLIDAIKAAKGKVLSSSTRFGAVRASIPLENIESVASRNDVKQVTPAAKAQTNMAHTEGDVAHAAHMARKGFGVTGRNIRVCVISDSIDDDTGTLRATAIQTGAIDGAKLSVIPGKEGSRGRGEGLAMVEIVQTIAPDAHVIFATGEGGQAAMAETILEMERQGCRIIVDDLTYEDESPFQDGPISIAIDEVSQNGVLYFSSAGNSGNKKRGTASTWEGDFEDGGAAGSLFSGTEGGRIHVFDKVKRVTLNTVDRAAGTRKVSLFWSDPLGAAANEYDIFIVNAKGNVVRSSTTSHDGQQDPYQSVDVRQGESIVIVKAADAEPRYLHLQVRDAVLRYSTRGSVRGHNASGARNAYSVAARRVPSPAAIFAVTGRDGVESYSSDGPRRVFYKPDGSEITPGNVLSGGGQLLAKPDITAAAGVTTNIPRFAPFTGTSAAAPHAAAIAALLLSCDPSPSPERIREAFRKSSLALDGSVPNYNAGSGIVMANSAARALCKMVGALNAPAGRPAPPSTASPARSSPSP